jgi:UDP-glucose 4-epimerase
MVKMTNEKYLVIGGAGFIGSNFVDFLLTSGESVIVFDNLISGNKAFLEKNFSNKKFTFIEDDILNWRNHLKELNEIDTIIHLASNADISAASIDPTLDFRRGTILTQEVAELSRIIGVKKILYASGSGVYGDHKKEILIEGITELLPNSPYGASKLSGEAILSSYSQMFGIKVACFRFANVVGPNQTHGVGLDFLNKLKSNSTILHILGDGKQSKSYIHVSEVIEAVLFVSDTVEEDFFVTNICNGDRIDVIEIATIAIETVGLSDSKTQITFSGGDRGWSGDVPIVNLSAEKLAKRGWKSKIGSKKAMQMSLESLWEQIS